MVTDGSFEDSTLSSVVRNVVADQTGALNGITFVKIGRIVHIRIPSFQILDNGIAGTTYDISTAIPVGFEPEYSVCQSIAGYVGGSIAPLRLCVDSSVIKIFNDNGLLNSPFGLPPGTDVNVSYMTA